MVDTVGRRSGQPRHTPVGGRLTDTQLWLVPEHGAHSDYVKNIKANPAVRLRIAGHWHDGTAHLLPYDDPIERLGPYRDTTAPSCG